jgi:O-antigen/teichoic acid export membrane protein
LGKHIKLNIITTILNVLIAGGSYFIVYKLLLKYVGVEELGVWSLVLASSSIANLANFGLTSSVVKFVASFNAQVDKKNEINKLLFTSTILMASIFIVVALILFVFSDFLLSTIIPLKHLLLAKALLPISLSCLVMNAIGGIFTSGLEGFQKNYIKNIIYVGASMLFIGFSYIFIQKLGLIGVAYAQLIQSLFILLFSLITLKFVCPAFTLLQWQYLIME